MPQILEHIDKIAREKGRDVLYIAFDKEVFPDDDYENWSVRNDLLEWFEENDINAIPCGLLAERNGFLILDEQYRGWLYLDVPFDENVPKYIKLRDHLENPDGSLCIPGVKFYYLPLEIAMKYKHHDEPGYWDNI